MAKKVTQLSELTSINGEDLLYAVDDPSGTPLSRKIKVSNVLTALNAGVAEGARVYNDAAISMTNADYTLITFNSESYDTNNIHSTSSNTSRLTCRTAGKYLISAQASWASNNTGMRRLIVKLNNTTNIGADDRDALSDGGSATNQDLVFVYELAVDDYIEIYGYQASGGALNINSPVFAMHRLTSTSLGTTEGAHVYRTTNQSIDSSSWIKVQFDNELYDTDNIHDNSTNNTRLTCRTAGKYVITGTVSWAQDTGGAYRGVRIRLNNTKAIGEQLVDATLTAGYSIVTCSAIYDLAVGDYVELEALHSKVTAINIVPGDDNPVRFAMQRIGEIDKATPVTGWIGADPMTYASADDPTYTMTCSGDRTSVYYAGQRIKLTQATGGTKYFIVTKVDYSDPNTTLTLYGGTDYNLENEAISTPYYSLVKTPAGFPLDPTKWTVITRDTSERIQNTPSANTWYNVGSLQISLPIGIWYVSFQATEDVTETGNDVAAQYVALSTANNSASDVDMKVLSFHHAKVATDTAIRLIQYVTSQPKTIVLTSKTVYYLNVMCADTYDYIDLRGDITPTIIRAVCAYL